ncbi:hypothetical protein AB0H88_01380 [Nonomuraea sp. NPDC050680]|jgi:hypothetical protein|uniref:hypothetical protein n=1 Tax=Nonomuraea sp. NPDC050680 TaxID=3154630 RepID=UPI0033CCBDB2
MHLDTKGLPGLWRPPIVEHAATTFSTTGDGGEARYLLAWGDTEGERWGFLLWPPQTLNTDDGTEHMGQAQWVRWQDIRPVNGEDYSTVPLCDPM